MADEGDRERWEVDRILANLAAMRRDGVSADTIAIILSYERAALAAWAIEIEGHLLQWARELGAGENVLPT